MTWLEIGNGWRNLFLLSCMIQAFALGSLFAIRHWMSKKSRLACFFTGAAATPVVQYLWMLLLSLLFPKAPRFVYIGIPPAAALLFLLVLFLRHVKQLPLLFEKGEGFAKKLFSFDKAALIALCFALCMFILLAPSAIRFMSSMDCVSGGDAGEYMGLAQRYCENRSLADLLEKEETVGHFRGHSHFPSLELYMSYGLFHTGGEIGYPNDKAAFTAIGLLPFYMGSAFLALLLHFLREKRMWVLLGLLMLNLVPNLYSSVAGAPRDIWRILFLLLAVLFFAGLTEKGTWKSYLGKLLLVFLLCFTVMSSHVVCFVVLPFIVTAWVIWRFFDAFLLRRGGAGKVLLRSVGLAVSGALGTLLAFSGNIFCFLKWGEMSPWRLMTTYTDAPWYPMYMDIEYKLEETTTHLNFFQAKDSILQSYATSIGDWGMWLALAVLVMGIAFLLSRRKKAAAVRSEEAIAYSENLSSLWFLALTVLLTLAPMTGVLDSPLYSFSGSFLKLPRYTLQWFMMAIVISCGFLSFLPDMLSTASRRFPHWVWLNKLPSALCVLLCVTCFVSGTKQTGYGNTFYRSSRGVVENDAILLDNSFRKEYGLLRQVAEQVGDDQKILITRVGYQYALNGKGYLLTSNPIVPVLNLKEDEIEQALNDMNAVMLATEPDFWDDRYYPLSTLGEYLQKLPEKQIIETEEMRLYLLDPDLAEDAHSLLAEGQP